MADMSKSNPAQHTTAFDWWVTLFAGWMLVGLYIDGWAHRHIPNLETFFTPWHGILYSGFFGMAGFLAFAVLRNYAKGRPWQEAVPAGYPLSLVGLAIFLVGGVGDLIWHTIFGIEADLDALLSPTHLLLAVGGVLMGAGPFRAAWHRAERTSPHGLFDLLPMLFSLTFGWSVLTFFTQFAHSFVHSWAAGSTPPDGVFFRQALELVGILLQSALMMGIVLLAVWRWMLPFGSLTLILTLNAALMSILELRYSVIGIGLLAGLGGDLLIRWLEPSSHRPLRLRLFAGALPALYYALYFLGLALTTGLWWPIDLWAGAIVMAGIVGWLLSYLLLPPRRGTT